MELFEFHSLWNIWLFPVQKIHEISNNKRMISLQDNLQRNHHRYHNVSNVDTQFHFRTIFDTIINNRIFERIAVILFLNKVSASFYNSRNGRMKNLHKKTLFWISTVFGVSVQPKAPNRFSHRMQLSWRCVSSNRLSHCHWQLRRWQHKRQF